MPILEIPFSRFTLYLIPALILWPCEQDGVWFWLFVGVGGKSDEAG